ncbi:D-Ala-D-Ala carboxypeptidase family metallohydrolase [Streptomyces sp. N2-109]|uniref:D-Ala-D-Ala carboxypeptidase family metallohydrolase n=1 Tax=Streptomyces gossypii TaxID=2883101 RepID=A0ABT2JNA0_9ACTN|nr:D-Ala-D-Ala carboxypeptidase family metallohydrolase [Streptomyces gossypii]MCT2589355.1 D-Ala-D-Ala carboxypeptidase family metallohydrolase [Streptomyces gossypii]
MKRRFIRLLVAFVMITTGMLAGSAATAAPSGSSAPAASAPSTALADGCYSWGRTLKSGMSGSDVRQLQIRVAGYPGYGGVLAIDGEFGPATKAAVTRFQRAYGLSADGIAGTQTFNKIYALQDNDCTPIHFTYAELNRCNSSWSGGAVSAATAKSNALRSMWKLEAMRHALGDAPIRVTSGFRSRACNDAVGGSPSSRHMYGDGVDLGAGSHSLCTMAKQARSHGFRGILGPGFPGHNDHTHVDHRSSRYWSASSCGI